MKMNPIKDVQYLEFITIENSACQKNVGNRTKAIFRRNFMP